MMKWIALTLAAMAVVACSSLTDTERVVPASTPSGQPYLFTDRDSIVYLSWIETIDSTHFLKYSRYANDAWSAPLTIASGHDWFVNWADYPVVAVNGGNFAATFLEKSGTDKFAYDVKLTTSRDGKTWSTPIVLHDDGKQAEHGFVTIIPYEGNFFITWLDGRNTVMEGMEGMEHHEGHHGQMSLRAAVIDPDGQKLNEWELDNRVCDCCQTSAAITSAGPVVVYRDRSRNEVRDISIVRLVDGTWTDPQPVFDDGWKIDGCPVNGPRIVAKGEHVVVAWYTGVNAPEVKVAFSDNNGGNFHSPLKIDEGKPGGRVDLALSPNFPEGPAYVTWMEGDEIRWLPAFDGKADAGAVVAKSSSDRAAGFPQMALRHDSGFVFAWTDAKTKRVMSKIWWVGITGD